MSIKFGPTGASLRVTSILNGTSDSLTTSSIRLATGNRIIKASDDAASLSIDNKLRSDSAIYAKGIRNLNDGISALTIAQNAISSLQQIIGRIAELSEQSANGTVNDTQRTIMQKEVTALQAEWNRVLDSTSFNGQKLLTGSDCLPVLHTGTEANSTLSAQIGEAALQGGFDNYAGGTELVSVSTAGLQGNSATDTTTRVSADGRYVAFGSLANNLVSSDTSSYDVFLRDRVAGTTVRVSTTSSGGQLTNAFTPSSYLTNMSADGRYVAFYSDATNGASGDTNGQFDMFLKDTVTGKLTCVSTNSSGVVSNGSSSYGVVSDDGRYVAFQSNSTDLVSGDTNGKTDIFLKDLLTGVTTRVNTDSSGGQTSGTSVSVGGISADGRYVLFNSDANNLVSGDGNGQRDVFVKDTSTGITTRVNTDSSGNQTTGTSSISFSISADGRYVAFSTTASNMVSGDTNGVADIFIKDLETGVTTRANTDSSGNQSTTGTGASSAFLSADGRYVMFMSDSSDLISGDTNGASDTFVKDTISGAISRINVSSSGAQDTTGFSPALGLSADGRYASFYSGASNLVSGDSNGLSDAFFRNLTKAGVQVLAGMVVSNKVSAKITLSLVKGYQDELSKYQGSIGASLTRAESYISSLGDARLNYSAASSRISDADMAQESAMYTVLKVKQQTASDLLRKVNLNPTTVLTLLGR